jgi:predicted permease
MLANNQSNNKVWRVLYGIGGLIILFGGITFVINARIPAKYQSVIAVISAVIWFASAYFFRQLPDKTENEKSSYYFAIGFGILHIVSAILIWLRANPKIVLLSGIYTLFASVLGLTTLYFISIQSLFPGLRQKLAEPLPDPLIEFPETTQEIINEGRRQINLPIIVIFLAAFLIGTGGSIVRESLFQDDSFTFLLICEALAIIIGISYSIFATYKWQKRARQSGIQEEELKAAAKAAKLWWPKNKEE